MHRTFIAALVATVLPALAFAPADAEQELAQANDYRRDLSIRTPMGEVTVRID